ncbi:hypothetical protein [Acidiphilium acidophilum]|uniref:hypothetical protein n=1 Tax=Acidiphilium acidophilum TaxID=76588 RepID=UPI002E8E7308|nr:hypothetical protein [Acidiphilium acidophilum]
MVSDQSHAEPVSKGVDLGERPKIILTAGRGKTGKTLFLRWLAEAAVKANRPHLLADIDPTNATFSSYFNAVARPNTFNQTAVRDWLQEFIEYAIAKRSTAIIDLGGGDTILRTIASEMPGFDAMIEDAGLSMVMFYLVGPHPEDLTPAATLSELGFNPRARAIVLNEGVAPLGTPRNQAFARVLSTDLYKKQIADGAIPLWMPRLFAADAIEARVAGFASARDGQTDPPLGIFDRSRVNTWLCGMDEQFAGINSWMP